LSATEAIAKIKESDLVNLTRDLVRLRSINPPGEEREAAEFVAKWMRNLGLAVDMYEALPGRPNVVGTLKGKSGNPVLMVNGHLDVVPEGDRASWSVDPFGGELKSGRLYGRGANDMKGAIASALIATKAIVESGAELDGDLMLAAVVDEEVSGAGTQRLVDKGYRADMAVVAEPTELKLHIAHKGLARVEIVTKGKAAHGSNPRAGLNAIYKMSKVVSALEAFLPELEKRKHPLVGNCSINVGTVQGGTKFNVVPDLCRIEVDRRLIPREPPDNVGREISEILTRLKSKDPELEAEHNIMRMMEPAEIGAEEPIVKLARKAVQKVTGVDPGISGFMATTDMRVLVNQAKIPTVIMGPGNLAQAHVADEFVEIRQLVDAAKIYAHLAFLALKPSKS